MHHLKFELEEPVTLCPKTWNELELLGAMPFSDHHNYLLYVLHFT